MNAPFNSPEAFYFQIEILRAPEQTYLRDLTVAVFVVALTYIIIEKQVGIIAIYFLRMANVFLSAGFLLFKREAVLFVY